MFGPKEDVSLFQDQLDGGNWWVIQVRSNALLWDVDPGTSDWIKSVVEKGTVYSVVLFCFHAKKNGKTCRTRTPSGIDTQLPQGSEARGQIIPKDLITMSTLGRLCPRKSTLLPVVMTWRTRQPALKGAVRLVADCAHWPQELKFRRWGGLH